jgi:hypothetical protein
MAKSSPLMRRFAMAAVVFALSYGTAYAETLTIAHVSRVGKPRGMPRL